MNAPRHPTPWPRLRLGLLFLFVFPLAAWAAEPAQMRYVDVPASDAVAALQRLAEQAGIEILFPQENVRGVRTNALKGQFTPRDALERLIAGTPLVATSTRGGAFAVKRMPDPKAPGMAPGGNRGDHPADAASGAQVRTNASGAAAAEAEEPTIVLSPFTVDADEDRGYMAENTLAGSRLKTSIRDTPAVISVFTEDFMKDVAANSILELVQYDANIQTEEFVSEGAIRGGSFNQATPNERDSFRSRGSTGSFSRDFFGYYSPQDPYNIDRADLSKGPNGVLFGIGAIGGTVNAQGRRALLSSQRSRLDLQAGSFGLRRAALDHNQVVKRGFMAVRVNLLEHDEDGYRYHTYQTKHRGTAAVALQLLPRTLLRANWEQGREKQSNQRPWGVIDNLSEWYGEGRVPAAYSNGRAVAQDTRGIAIYNNNNPHLTFVDQAGALLNMSRTAYSTTYNDQAKVLSGSTYVDNPAFRANYNAGARARVLHDDPAAFGPLSVSNRIGSSGPDAYNLNTFDNAAVVLEHSFSRDLQAELSFFRESMDTYGQNPGATNLLADPNDRLGNGTTSNPMSNAAVPPAGSENPYFGRTYIENDWSVRDLRREQYALRALLAYELDLGKRASQPWLRSLLGRHRLAGMVETNQQRIAALNMVEVMNYATRTSGIWSTANVMNPENDANRIFRRNYVTFGDWEHFHTGRFTGPGSHVLGQSSVSGRTVATALVPSGGGQISDDIIDDRVRMFAMQSSFWNNRLVGTFGYRADRIRILSADTVRDGLDSNGDGSLDTPTDRDGDGESFEWILSGARSATRTRSISRSMGAVFHVLPSFGLFYNRSSGKQLPKLDQTVGPDGRITPGNTGETEDFGFLFSLFDNRVSGRINHYETQQKDTFIYQTAGFTGASGVASQILDVLQNAGLITAAENDAHVPRYNGGLMNNRSRGYEARLVANIGQGLSVVFNYSYTDRVNNGILADIERHARVENAFYAERLAAVGATTSSPAVPGTGASLRVPSTGSGANAFPEESIQERINRVYSEILLENIARGYGFAERPHKVALTANQQFRTGLLSGFSFGGTFRWQSRIQLGRIIQFDDRNGNFVPDQGEVDKLVVLRNLEGPDFTQVDLHLRYRFNRFLGRKGGLELQCNVYNLLNDDDIIPTALNANQSGIAQYKFRDPRSYRFTLRYEF